MAPQTRGSRRHARQPSEVNVNGNTAWLGGPGVWVTYLALLLLTWLALCAACATPGRAWAATQLAHFGVTFPLFHWHKGSPIAADQGVYDRLTFWEQMDGGAQLTATKKFFTVVPLALYLLGFREGDPRGAQGWACALVLAVLLLAKVPAMHQVRLFGINR